MARYQIPPDPRKSEKSSSHAQKVDGQRGRSSPPWLWIGLGAIVTVLAIAVAVLWARLLLDIPEVDEAPTPTVVLQTAVPTVPPSPATVGTVAPTEPAEEQEPVDQPVVTEEPTSVPAGGITVGVTVTVFDTGVGLNLRAEPVVDPSNIVALVPDGTALEVVGGPEEAGDFVWWQLRMTDGTEGWGVDQFLQVP